MCVCVCVYFLLGGASPRSKTWVELLFPTRPCGHVRIKYSVIVKSNLIIKYVFNFNIISLYGSNSTSISFNILLLFSGLYGFRSAGRSSYHCLLSLITAIGLIILALVFLISIESMRILLRAPLIYPYQCLL